MESISEAFSKCFVADFICSISRTIKDKSANTARRFIAKNRNGPDGLVFPMFMDTSVVQLKVLSEPHAPKISPNMGPGDLASALREKYKQHRQNIREKDIDAT